MLRLSQLCDGCHSSSGAVAKVMLALLVVSSFQTTSDKLVSHNACRLLQQKLKTTSAIALAPCKLLLVITDLLFCLVLAESVVL